jgi:uncharacterized peroxidase-related enzyme
MQYINIPNKFPGIRSLFMCRPESASQLDTLIKTLLHNPHPTLTCGERELIAAYVSRLNTCKYCYNIHGSMAPHQLTENAGIIKQVLTNPQTASISNKMKALLKIAGGVQSGYASLSNDDIAFYRNEGLSDIEIRDAALIADAFCMYNCYVAALSTWQPDDVELYDKMEERYIREGIFELAF